MESDKLKKLRLEGMLSGFNVFYSDSIPSDSASKEGDRWYSLFSKKYYIRNDTYKGTVQYIDAYIKGNIKNPNLREYVLWNEVSSYTFFNP